MDRRAERDSPVFGAAKKMQFKPLGSLSRATADAIVGGTPCSTSSCVVQILPPRFPTMTRTYGNFRITLHESYIAIMDEAIAEFAMKQPAEFAVMGTQGGYGQRARSLTLPSKRNFNKHHTQVVA